MCFWYKHPAEFVSFGTPGSPDGGSNMLLNRPASSTTGCNIAKNFSQINTNAYVSLWFYDNNTDTTNSNYLAVIRNTEGTSTISVGIRNDMYPNSYVFGKNINGVETYTEIKNYPRAKEWNFVEFF